MGFNPDLLKAGIDRLRDMKHSAMTTEQAHAAGAVYLKLHRMYGQETMRARSFAYQMKPLLAADPVCAKVAKLQRQLEKVKKQNPNKIGAWQAFCCEMQNLATRQKQAGVASAQSKDTSKLVLQRCGPVFAQFGSERKRSFTHVAESMRKDKLVAKNARIAALVAEIEVAKQRAMQESDADRPLTLATCRLLPIDIIDIERTLLHFNDSAEQIAAWVSMRNGDLHMIKPHIEETLSQFDVQEVNTTSVKFWWLSLVCRNRDHFSDSVFKFTVGMHSDYYKFCFALQNPLLAAFVKVIPEVHAAQASADPMAQLHNPEMYVFDHYFSCDYTEWAFSDKEFAPLQSEVEVLTGVYTSPKGGAELRGDGAFQSLVLLSMEMHGGQEPSAPSDPAEDTGVQDSEAPLWVDYPWLLQEK